MAKWLDAHYHRGFGDGENNEIRTTIGVLVMPRQRDTESDGCKKDVAKVVRSAYCDSLDGDVDCTNTDKCYDGDCAGAKKDNVDGVGRKEL